MLYIAPAYKKQTDSLELKTSTIVYKYMPPAVLHMQNTTTTLLIHRMMTRRVKGKNQTQLL